MWEDGRFFMNQSARAWFWLIQDRVKWDNFLTRWTTSIGKDRPYGMHLKKLYAQLLTEYHY
jgi:hypothetical protein